MPRIELHGIPRHRAGVAGVDVVATNVADALRELAERVPILNTVCLRDGALRPGYLLSLNGRLFVDADCALAPTDVLLLLSSDAGG